jgi:NCAIR mutase (PurE)-related protein
MGTEDRLKGIMARQAAAAKAKQSAESEDQAAAAKAQLLRASVVEKWHGQRVHIESFINQTNKQISKNGVQLFVRASGSRRTGVTKEVDRMEIAFDAHTDNLKKLTFSVRPDGDIFISMGTSYDAATPAKQSILNVLKNTNDELEGTVLDFLDINTPK